MNDDAYLLRRFANSRAEDAFAELVSRHLNLVYFAALRQTRGDTHSAEDAAQVTFTLLAKKAGSLAGHPNLAGWLHSSACNHARDLMRTERRRSQREQTAHLMHELTAAETNDQAWTQIRPVIDDALADLAPDDREAILQRYFENRAYSEIGDTLQLGENAARMRVNRALGQLETALARRGVKSTAAVLASVLTIPAALAAPVNLATSITTSAIAATAIVGTTATGFTLFKIMSSAKLIATATTVAAIAAIGTAVYQNQQLQSARAETTVLRRQQVELQAQFAGLKDQLATEKKRADDADADNGRLLAVTSNALVEKNTPQAPITRDIVGQRYKNAQTLSRNGQNEEALKEFLWCYDTGMLQVPSFAGVRGSYLLEEIAKLGKSYPLAFAALQERRVATEQRVHSSVTDTEAVGDYASLNHALGEDDKNLALFTSLPADDVRRQALGLFVGDQLLAAQRYTDIIQTKPFSRMMMLFGIRSSSTDRSKVTSDQQRKRANSLASTASKDIEALAGAGELDNANKLIGRLLEFDNSAETRAKIQTHLARAGHPELLKTP